ncbi:MAG: alpha/beta fold hydrolase [Cyanobacteria bacterium P01_D01_bin.115]
MPQGDRSYRLPVAGDHINRVTLGLGMGWDVNGYSETAMEQLIFGLLGLATIAYAALCLTLWWGQTRLIFYPQPAPTTTPASVGLAYEDIQIPVDEGHIHGWWLPHEAPDAKTALVLHGNASNVADTLNWAQPLLAAGLSALVIDYRGYGLSSGPFPNESRAYADAAAAWAYLVETRGIPADAIVIFGHSIGGAIAIDLAYHQPQAAGLIVQASFTSMTAMMEHVGTVGLCLNGCFISGLTP